jgi:uncharacterized metal-binding protein
MITMETVIDEAMTHYAANPYRRFYTAAALVEKNAFDTVRGRTIPVRPRVQEVIEFAKHIHARKIGVAFCGGLSAEASRFTDILETHGFKVYSAMCKCGNVDKARLGVPEAHKFNPDTFEAACNPLAQSALFNRVETDLNVILGLCIGHDILFTMHSTAPVTTLVVKDRYTGHNPAVSLHCKYHNSMIEGSP